MQTRTQVRYEVRETSIGKGLFLLEPVAKGALIWRFVAPTIIAILIVINIAIRYREGENILCFRNEAETRKHLDSMASDADRFIMIGIIIVLINITIIEFPPLFKISHF